MLKFILFTLLFLSFNVDASCNRDELERLRQLAEKVEFTYQHKIEKVEEFDGVFDEITFDITALNLNSDLKVLIINDYYNDDYLEFKYNSNGYYTLTGFSNSQKVDVTFKAFVANECSGTTVYTKTINLPFYNTYLNTDECKQYPEFKYCKEYLDSQIKLVNPKIIVL